jgi:hypothetical protein
MRRAVITAAVLAFSLSAVGAAPALAAPCKDAKGKFIKCAPPAPVKAVRCKDAKGKFAKCDAPGAKPA